MSKERKTEFIIVRVTPTEKSNFLKGAKKLGQTISQYVRALLELGK